MHTSTVVGGTSLRHTTLPSGMASAHPKQSLLPPFPTPQDTASLHTRRQEKNPHRTESLSGAAQGRGEGGDVHMPAATKARNKRREADSRHDSLAFSQYPATTTTTTTININNTTASMPSTPQPTPPRPLSPSGLHFLSHSRLIADDLRLIKSVTTCLSVNVSKGEADVFTRKGGRGCEDEED
ncbi:hypothetical protein E2C01_051905 [Portunus trituberculatus]|uniref:Uncharacterized protein n=1 Tax=Portunus trituberculatus TaxID=210409 RepID=A0A5B7GKA9_PORTR|nr:hypothetical protein [Portunus trituberculatus]